MKNKLVFVFCFLLNANLFPCAEEIKVAGEPESLSFTTSAGQHPISAWDASMKPPFAFGANLYIGASNPTPAPTPYTGPWLYYKYIYEGKTKNYNVLYGGNGLITWLDTTSTTGLTYNWYSQIAFQGDSWQTFRTWMLDASKNGASQKPLAWPLPNNMPQFVEVGGWDPVTGVPFIIYQWQVQPAWRNASTDTAQILQFVSDLMQLPLFY